MVKEAEANPITILRLCELHYHDNGGLASFYAAVIRMRTGDGNRFVNITFELFTNPPFTGEIDIFSARITDNTTLNNRYNGPLICAHLDKFLRSKGKTIEQWERELNTA